MPRDHPEPAAPADRPRAADGGAGRPPVKIAVGLWEMAARLDGDEVVSASPCHRVTVSILAREIGQLGETDVRCPECHQRWTVRFNPWSGRTTALWVD